MSKLIMRHYSDVPPNYWPWKNFAPHEFASNGNGAVEMDIHTLNCLQSLREEWGEPIILNSAYRDPVYNARIGGAPLSKHKEGRALDVGVRGWSPEKKYKFKELAFKHGFTGFGGYNTFIHIDTGRPRKWKQSWAWPDAYKNPKGVN